MEKTVYCPKGHLLSCGKVQPSVIEHTFRDVKMMRENPERYRSSRPELADLSDTDIKDKAAKYEQIAKNPMKYSNHLVGEVQKIRLSPTRLLLSQPEFRGQSVHRILEHASTLEQKAARFIGKGGKKRMEMEIQDWKEMGTSQLLLKFRSNPGNATVSDSKIVSLVSKQVSRLEKIASDYKSECRELKVSAKLLRSDPEKFRLSNSKFFSSDSEVFREAAYLDSEAKAIKERATNDTEMSRHRCQGICGCIIPVGAMSFSCSECEYDLCMACTGGGCHACGASSVGVKACSRCKKIYYCGQECHSKHWKTHKPLCRILTSELIEKKNLSADAPPLLPTSDSQVATNAVEIARKLRVGITVKIRGLNNRLDLNGKRGLVASYDIRTRRYIIKVKGEEMPLALKEANVIETCTPSNKGDDDTQSPTLQREPSNSGILETDTPLPVLELPLVEPGSQESADEIPLAASSQSSAMSLLGTKSEHVNDPKEMGTKHEESGCPKVEDVLENADDNLNAELNTTFSLSTRNEENEKPVTPAATVGDAPCAELDGALPTTNGVADPANTTRPAVRVLNKKEMAANPEAAFQNAKTMINDRERRLRLPGRNVKNRHLDIKEDSNIDTILRIAAKAGHAEAQYFLGDFCFAASRRIEAVKWWTASANQGHAAAQYKVGQYQLPRNFSDGISFIRRSAGQDYPIALKHLGVLYATGQGVPMDLHEAESFFSKAASLGDIESSLDLANVRLSIGIAYMKKADYNEAFTWVEKASDSGNVAAMDKLAFFYYRGKGVPRNMDKAVSLWTRASDKGDLIAPFQLGVVFLEQGSFELAETWLLKIKNNNALACNLLGDMHQKGNVQSGEVNTRKAIIYYRLALAMRTKLSPEPTKQFAEAFIHAEDALKDLGEAIHAKPNKSTAEDLASTSKIVPMEVIPVPSTYSTKQAPIDTVVAKEEAPPMNDDAVIAEFNNAGRSGKKKKTANKKKSAKKSAANAIGTAASEAVDVFVAVTDDDLSRAADVATAKVEGVASEVAAPSEVHLPLPDLSNLPVVRISSTGDHAEEENEEEKEFADCKGVISDDYTNTASATASCDALGGDSDQETALDIDDDGDHEVINEVIDENGVGSLQSIDSVDEESAPWVATMVGVLAPLQDPSSDNADTATGLSIEVDGVEREDASKTDQIELTANFHEASSGEVLGLDGSLTTGDGLSIASLDGDDVDFLTCLKESQEADAERKMEDDTAQGLVSAFLEQRSSQFCKAFNPPRDGDCLMRCAVEHDFGRPGAAGKDDDLLASAVEHDFGPQRDVPGSGESGTLIELLLAANVQDPEGVAAALNVENINIEEVGLASQSDLEQVGLPASDAAAIVAYLASLPLCKDQLDNWKPANKKKFKKKKDCALSSLPSIHSSVSNASAACAEISVAGPSDDAVAASIPVQCSSSEGASNTSEDKAPLPSPSQVYPADEYRLLVVERVRVNKLALLQQKRETIRTDLKACEDDGSFSPKVARLREELNMLDGIAMAELDEHCDSMSKPGMVMGEDELQALADVRGACVEVNSIICVRGSSDFGAFLKPKIYAPKLAPLISIVAKQESAISVSMQGVTMPPLAVAAIVGIGDTLVLLQETRAHRMSHFQLLKR